ncbi:transcriptional regulator [Pseudomonas sp. FW300-N1A1]|uniref:transcriptional regulator n=1 Tax=Pseudomonas sp. FW300-N1A1 TaxID=2075555 RepID=UPI000CD31C89|nr:transcriptional regulator [Pseudomonas sp. FW300-N1A1]POA22383.1 transcriptional regulator [Pseudomonas sp. FW300-N1A1]
MSEFFPIECADRLHAIGLLVKNRRLQNRQRQKDLALSVSISERTLRKIEAGDASVELRSFMLVLWHLGLTFDVFQTLDAHELASRTPAHDVRPAQRVRLPRSKGDF